VCGDGICGGQEDPVSCPADCEPVTVGECGNGICQDTEDAGSCIVDCGGQECRVFSRGNLEANQDRALQLVLSVPAGQYIACKTTASTSNSGDSDLYMQVKYCRSDMLV